MMSDVATQYTALVTAVITAIQVLFAAWKKFKGGN